MNEPILHAEALKKRYVEGVVATEVLHGLDLSVQAGERVAIIGASGSGKSTLLHLLGGLDDPSEGVVWVCGTALHTLDEGARARFRNQNMGFVYQFHHLLAEFSATENVMMPLVIKGADIKDARRQANELLERVGLSHRTHHRPSELSGGERQRVAIARALVVRPKIVLADEPTGNLDQSSSDAVFELLTQMQSDYGTAMVLVTHDRNLAHKTDRVLTLQDGAWV